MPRRLAIRPPVHPRSRPRPALAWPMALLVGTLAAAPLAVQALDAGQTPQGRPYVSGGVSQDELVALHARRDWYSLWVITAATRSGAHLADARVIIREAGDTVVFNRRLDGPWLFIDLPPGSYEVEAWLGSTSHKRRTTLHDGDRRQLMFYFDTGDEVAPENRSPFDRNPYDGARPPGAPAPAAPR